MILTIQYPELNMGDWKDEKTREMSYIKPLNAPMGPKETLVNLKDETEKIGRASCRERVS